MSDEDPNQPFAKALEISELELARMSVRYDHYQSVRDSKLLIFVANDTVPPFRFKSGGWELLQSSIELGSAMQARVAENGFFMVRINEDKVGWTELSGPQTPYVGATTESEKTSETNQKN